MKVWRPLVVAVSVVLLGGAVSAPAVADPLPSGKSRWGQAGVPNPMPWRMKRSGEWVKLVFSDVTYRGTVSGNTMRLRPNEGYGAVTYNAFRYNGRILKIQWEGRSKWTRFKRLD